MEWLSKSRPDSFIGLWSVLLRFGLTSLTTLLLLVFLKRTPFAPSYIPFLKIEDYYKAEAIFLPLWGIGIWLIMGVIARVLGGMTRNESALKNNLNIIGLGMLAPMAILWIWDWTMISLDLHKAVIQAIAHTVAQTWEGAVEAVGFRKVLGLKLRTAIIMAVVINVVFIFFAALLVR